MKLGARTVKNQAAEVVALYGLLGRGPSRTPCFARAVSSRRRIVVATNIAETSVTVPGDRAGCPPFRAAQGLPVTMPSGAIDSLESGAASRRIRPISARAAPPVLGLRFGAPPVGCARRPKAAPRARDSPRRSRPPRCSIILVSGGKIRGRSSGSTLRADEGRRGRADAPRFRLGAVEGAQLTDVGRRLQRIPLPPRLARMPRRSRRRDVDGASLCAPLGAPCAGAYEGPRRRRPPRTSCPRSIDGRASRPTSSALHERFEQFATRWSGEGANRSLSESEFRRAVLAGYPDCVAQRREPRSPRVRLASGAGAVVAAGKRRDRGRVPRRPGRSLVEFCRLSRPRSPESGHLACQHSSCEPCRTRVACAQREGSCASTRSRHRHRQGDGVHPLRRSCPH